MSRLYLKHEHGELANFLSILSIGVAVVTFKYDQAIMVEDDRDKARNLVKLSLWINIAWFVVISLALLVFKPWILSFYGLSTFSTWLYFIPITIFTVGCVETLTVWWNRERKYRKLSANRIVGSAVSASYKTLHGWLSSGWTNGLVAGHFFGQLLNALLFLPRTTIKHLKTDWKELKALALKYANFPKWAMTSTLVNAIGAGLPIFIITGSLGQDMTGYMSNAQKLTHLPMSAVSLAIGQVFYERLARLRSEKDRFQLSLDILKFLYVLAIVPVLIMMVWGDVIAPFILGKDWGVAGEMTRIVVLFYFVMYLSSPFAVAFEVYNRLNLQFVYTTVFTLFTGLALYLTIHFGGNVYWGLTAFCATGIVVRIAMMISCFKLIGHNPIRKIITGLIIIVVSFGLLYLLRQQLI